MSQTESVWDLENWDLDIVLLRQGFGELSPEALAKGDV
jgi:hypothetical protein